jgi:hypothetical protein
VEKEGKRERKQSERERRGVKGRGRERKGIRSCVIFGPTQTGNLET